MKNIFVVIVTYNGMKWMQECLTSVCGSSISVEIVVVDNKSTDETVGYIESNFPKVNLLKQSENLGFGKANNIGMTFALQKNADFVFLLNQDAKIEKNTIERLIEVSEKNIEFGILSPVHLNWDNSDLEYGFYNNRLFRDLVKNVKLNDIYEEDRFINASCWLLPINSIRIVGGFDPLFFHYGEDVNYCQRIIFHKLKLGIVPDVSVFHDTTNNGVKKELKTVLEEQNHVFLNSVLLKYANVNVNNYDLFIKFKRMLLVKAIIYLFFNFSKSKKLYKNYILIKEIPILESIKRNKLIGTNYLE